MLAEYLLCAREHQDISTWGAMPADLIYVSADNRSVVIVENKIGSRFTSGGGDVESGQLARQAEYLCRWKDRRGLAGASLILLTTTECIKIKSGNYLQVFNNTLKAHANRCERIQGFVMLWEDIFDAFSHTSAV